VHAIDIGDKMCSWKCFTNWQ